MRAFIRSFAIAGLLASAGAQETLRHEGPSPATLRLGDTSQIVVQVEGRGANPRAPELPKVDGLRFDLQGPFRQEQSFYDGRSLRQSFTVQYGIKITALREGTFTIPEIPIWTGSKTQKVSSTRLDVVKDMKGGDRGYLDVQVSPRRVYVHEPIRVAVDFGVDAGLKPVLEVANDRTRYVDYEVQAPWLSRMEGAETLPAPPLPSDQQVGVVKNRELQRAVFDGEHQRNGRQWNRFTWQQSFLPTRIGKLQLAAPLLRYNVMLREGQVDIFGGRRGQQTENFYVYGQPIEIEVVPIPEDGRPNPYYGAVGRFAIEARLDKEQVKVGASVKLIITIRGEGNLEFLRVPSLEGVPGFGRERFHLLGQTEKRDADKVIATYDLTPLVADIRAVPAVPWNWFDTTPGVEKFVSAATAELPLTVRPLEKGETLAALPEAESKPITPGVDDVFDIPDLAGSPVPTPSLPRLLAFCAVLGPWLCVAAAMLLLGWWQKRAADLLGQRARGAARACARDLGAGTDPATALAGYLAARLGIEAAAIIGPEVDRRLVESGLEEEQAREVQQALDRGVAARYGGGGGLGKDEVERLVAQLERVTLRRAATLLPFLLALAIAGTTGPVRTQGEAATALAAYRAGDYRTAESGFAQAIARSDDRRLWRARGNCWYRLEDLPRALWCYETARLGLPRDPELLANIALVRSKLELGSDDAGGEGFTATLLSIRERFSPGERAIVGAVLMTGAALLLLGFWRRIGRRWLGVLLLLPGVAIALDLLWLSAERQPAAIALEPLALVAEPRTGMTPIATIRPGYRVQVLPGGQGEFARVSAGERSGYVPASTIARIE
ncbi:MAG: BatD family protein [Planctomycetes bacterium]|nr:BatD family protein [Planctomycetota bacterium]